MGEVRAVVRCWRWEGTLGGGVRYWWGTGVGRGEMVVREGLGDGGREYGRERRGGGVGMGWEGCTGRGEGHWDRVGRGTGIGWGQSLVRHWEWLW